MFTKRVKVCIAMGAILGVICIIGASVRSGRYCQMLWMDKFTSFGTLTVTPLYPPALHPGIFYSPAPVESFDIPEVAASSFLPPGPI